MKHINTIIEKMQSDHEDSQLEDHIDIQTGDDYFMVNNSLSTSLFSTKVVYAHETKDMDAKTLYHQAQTFFLEKPFSWYLNASTDQNIQKHLDKNGWIEHDRYDGMYYEISKNMFYESHYEVREVIPGTKDIDDLAYIASCIWGSSGEEQLRVAKDRYATYLTASDCRGGYLLAYFKGEPIGYGSYRLSKDRNVLYLSGTGVLEPYRNKGVYRSLLNYRLKFGQANNIKYAVTQARVGHSSPILSKIGFVKVETFLHYIPNSKK